MKRIKSLVLALAVAGCVIASGGGAYASVIWGNSASFGNVNLEAFDISGGTAVLVDQFLVPNLTARSDNGRGVALLGNTIYYTTAGSGNIYVTTTGGGHPDLGILVNTGFSGIANIATDGTFIYANNYVDSSGIINKYDTSGVLQGSITVGPGLFGRDGFEVQNNPNINGGALTFISNRGDLTSPYDVYDAAGTLILPAFIDPAADGFGTGQTGIAYDGNHYFVSQIFGNSILEYDGTGNFIGAIDLSGIPNPFTGRALEDLSAVGNTIGNPPPNANAIPEPSTMFLLGSGLIGLAGFGRKRLFKKG